MPEETAEDYYDVLQISTNAEPETINRVFRLLAQRFHPDNQQTGDDKRFRIILEAYSVLSDPEQRARYDIRHERQRKDRWRLVETGDSIENDFELERVTRLAILEALYAKRRMEPNSSGLSILELEKLIGRPREHLEFTIWFLLQKQFVVHGDHSNLSLTVNGVEYLEDSYEAKKQPKRLRAGDVE
jgi:curved DNA-binding protein CbpA